MSTHATLLVIRDEHSALSAVLRSISPLLSEHRRRHTLPDFTVLRAMLFYIDEFPEQIHHTKESELLFRRSAHEAPKVPRFSIGSTPTMSAARSACASWSASR